MDQKTVAPTLAQQVHAILHAKIGAIARHEYIRANPKPLKIGQKFKPYSLPVIVDTLRAMLAEVADETTPASRLEEIAAFATTGECQERALGNRSA